MRRMIEVANATYSPRGMFCGERGDVSPLIVFIALHQGLTTPARRTPLFRPREH